MQLNIHRINFALVQDPRLLKEVGDLNTANQEELMEQTTPLLGDG